MRFKPILITLLLITTFYGCATGPTLHDDLMLAEQSAVVELDADSNGAVDEGKGGTNSTTFAGALSNIGAEPADSAITKSDENETITGTWALGSPTATTPAENDNDTSVATTAYVQTEISGFSGGHDAVTLDTMTALLFSLTGQRIDFDLADPDADRAIIWDDDPGVFAWFDLSSLSSGSVTKETLDTNCDVVDVAATLASNDSDDMLVTAGAIIDYVTGFSLSDFTEDLIDASGFDGNLETTDDTVQELAQAVDDLSSGSGYVEFEVVSFGLGVDITTGNGKGGSFTAGDSLNGLTLTELHVSVNTAGTTGTTDIQIYNVTDSVDVLSTVLTIDSGETGSETAETAYTINTSNDDISEYDRWRIDIDDVQTLAPTGNMIVRLKFE